MKSVDLKLGTSTRSLTGSSPRSDSFLVAAGLVIYSGKVELPVSSDRPGFCLWDVAAGERFLLQFVLALCERVRNAVRPVLSLNSDVVSFPSLSACLLLSFCSIGICHSFHLLHLCISW